MINVLDSYRIVKKRSLSIKEFYEPVDQGIFIPPNEKNSNV